MGTGNQTAERVIRIPNGEMAERVINGLRHFSEALMQTAERVHL